MRCHYIGLLAGILFVFSLTACSQPMTIAESVGQLKVGVVDMGNGVCRQFPSGLMWQIEASKSVATGEEANAYVHDLQLGGFEDWRLPTREECLDLSELLLMKKGDCPIKIKKGHWVQGRRDKVKPGHWEDYPLCGGSEFRWVKTKQGSVWAVRP
jgi:hypothetical protein